MIHSTVFALRPCHTGPFLPIWYIAPSSHSARAIRVPSSQYTNECNWYLCTHANNNQYISNTEYQPIVIVQFIAYHFYFEDMHKQRLQINTVVIYSMYMDWVLIHVIDIRPLITLFIYIFISPISHAHSGSYNFPVHTHHRINQYWVEWLVHASIQVIT